MRFLSFSASYTGSWVFLALFSLGDTQTFF